ncbi:MAG: hypothetical protein WC708_00220 [Lentisphaeria bacterium]|jgi:hypothetical protein
MKNAEIAAIHVSAIELVTVACDNEHVHSALKGCVVPNTKAGGTDKDVIICKLCEVIKINQSLAAEALAKIAGK